MHFMIETEKRTPAAETESKLHLKVNMFTGLRVGDLAGYRSIVCSNCVW